MTLDKLPYDVGEMIADHYVVFSVLERSSHSGTYQARDTQSRNWVVVKVLFKTVGTGESRRFEQDMRKVVALRDPSIVPTLDAGVLANGHRYVCYEQLDGDTLASTLKTGPMKPDQALETMLQVARGLCAAHEAGVVHGGLTPRNIVLAREGIGRRARVTDFGLAEHASSGGQLNPGPGDSITGSVRHRAPELIGGGSPSRASDIYAWGLIYLECLTGSPVLAGGSYAAIRRSQSKLDPMELAPHLEGRPEAEVLSRVLHQSESRRISSAVELLSALGLDPDEDAPAVGLPQRVSFDSRSSRATKAVQKASRSPEEEIADILDVDDFDSLGEALFGSDALSIEVEDSALIEPDPELVTYDGYETDGWDDADFDGEISDLEPELLSEDNPLAELDLAPEPLGQTDPADEDAILAADEPLTWNLQPRESSGSTSKKKLKARSPQEESTTSNDVGIETLRKLMVLEPPDEDGSTPLRSSRIPQTIGVALLGLMLVGLITAIVVLAVRKGQEVPEDKGTETEVASQGTTGSADVPSDSVAAAEEKGENGNLEKPPGVEEEPEDNEGMDFDFADSEAPLTCEDGDAYACYERGAAALNVPWPERDEVQAAADLAKACELDEAYCALLGVLHLNGRGGMEKNTQQAYELVKKSCIGGNEEACVLQGQMIVEGEGTSQDYDKGIALLEPACENGLHGACTTLAELKDRGKGRYERNLTEAAEMLAAACEGGHGRACGLLAEKYRKGRGVDRSAEKRVELLHKGCEQGGGESACYELGDLYRRGRGGVEKDSAGSAEFYQKGCSNGYSRSCDNACYMLQSGEVEESTVQDALPWCDAGCKMGYDKACYRGGRFAEIADEQEMALRLYSRGCELGHRKSCRRAD